MVIGGVFASFLVFKCVMFITMCMCSSQPPSSGSSACCFHKICINHAHAMQITSPLTYLVFFTKCLLSQRAARYQLSNVTAALFLFLFCDENVTAASNNGRVNNVFPMFFCLLLRDAVYLEQRIKGKRTNQTVIWFHGYLQIHGVWLDRQAESGYLDF